MFSEFCLSSLLICITWWGLQAYTLHLMIIFVLICTVGINAVREVMWWWTWFEWFSVRGHSILKFGAVRWRCRYFDDEVLILPWRRRLSPVATRRRLVSAEYFCCLLIKHVIFLYVFFKENLKRWLVCFLSARLTHQKKSNFWLKVSNFNKKAPGRLAKMSHGQVIYDSLVYEPSR